MLINNWLKFSGLCSALVCSVDAAPLADLGEGSDGTAGGGGDPAPVAAPAERTFTQTELERIVQDRLARDRRARQPAAPTTTTAPPPPADPMEAFRRQREIDFLAIPAGLNRDQADMLAQHYERHGNGASIEEWFPGAITRLKWGQAAAPPTAAPPPAAPARPPATVSAGVGQPRPVDHLQSGELIDVTKLSLDELEALGPQGIRAAVDKAASQARSRLGAPRIPQGRGK